MVAQLETLLQDAGSSPEVQWRSRILVQSSKDADRDIQERLQQVSESSSPSSRTQVALRKLHRDFGRVRTQLRQILQSYERKQQVEVSFLNKQDETREEFFDRAMRERDAEVQRIHKSMHQVNSIYQVSICHSANQFRARKSLNMLCLLCLFCLVSSLCFA